MHRTCMLCLSLLLVTAIGKAQLYSSKTWQGDTGKVYFRMNWMGLLDLVDGNASVGGEMRLSKTWSVVMDAGYIFYAGYLPKTSRVSGIILRPGMRLYAGKLRNVFFDMQLHYKGVRYHVNDWLDKDVVNTVSSYEERKIFQVQKRVYGGQITVGGKEFISRNYRWVLEFYIGVGLHYREQSLYNEPNSQYSRRINFFGPDRLTSAKSTKVVPSFPLGIRLVHTLR